MEEFIKKFQYYKDKLIVFFKPLAEKFYPIPIWYYDESYQPKFNISSSKTLYNIN